MPTLSDQITSALTESGIVKGFTVDVRVSSRRRTWGITVEPGGAALTLHAPATAQPEDAVTFVRKVRPRVGRAVNKAREHAPEHPINQLVGGEAYYWLGQPARLCVLDGAAQPVERVNTGYGWWLHVDRRAVAAHGSRPIVSWYCAHGTEWLEKEAPAWWGRMAAGREPLPELRVADIGRKRWGKYEPKRHRVTLAWQALQMPLPLVRYLVVHELAHATRPRGQAHGPEFWRVMERTTMPSARAQKRRLDEQGRAVWMGDIDTVRPPSP